MYTTGIAQINYQVVDGSSNYSDTGTLNVTLSHPGDTVVASDFDTDSFVSGTKTLNVNQYGTSSIPNSNLHASACEITSYPSPNIGSATCTCDGLRCSITYSVGMSQTGGAITYIVRDVAGDGTVYASDTGTLTINVVYGCTDSNYDNYNPAATANDGSCMDYVWGCTNNTYTNYNPLATNDDGSCAM
jgi:hypothetical protein